jgi:predicted Zn-dependent protease
VRLFLLAVLCALAIVPSAQGWTTAGRRWPGTTITVWNATGYRGAVSDAMWAWSSVGANIHFEQATRRRDADVLIGYGAMPSDGLAEIGYKPGLTRVWIGRGLNSRVATVIAAHELGHVLGFAHSSHRCSLMAPIVNGGSSAGCRVGYCEVIWRCLVQPDDVRGLKSRYGLRPPG